MVTIAETSEYARRAQKLLSEIERNRLIWYLASNPLAGALLEGTGGVRKLRWRREDRGKRGGVRVVYFFYNENIPLYLLTIFGKNEKENLSAAERNELAKLSKLLVQAAKKDKGEDR